MSDAAEQTLRAVRELLDEPSDERGITWWEWIDGGLGGDLYARLRALLVPCGAREDWDTPHSKGWHLCTRATGHVGDHYNDMDFKTWPNLAADRSE